MKLSITVKNGKVWCSSVEYKWWNPVATYKQIKGLLKALDESWSRIEMLRYEVSGLKFDNSKLKRFVTNGEPILYPKNLAAAPLVDGVNHRAAEDLKEALKDMPENPLPNPQIKCAQLAKEMGVTGLDCECKVCR